MTQRTYRKWWPAAMLAALLLTACGSPDNPASVSDTDGQPPSATSQKASVTFSIKFPEAAIQKALMDQRTVSIQVQWHDYYGYNQLGSVELFPDQNGMAQTTVEVPIGPLEFTAWAYDSNYMELGRTATAGEIVAGDNTVILRFLSGDWQFVDAGDSPQTLAVADNGGNTTNLAGFSLAARQEYGPMMAQSAGKLDETKPSGWIKYGVRWFAQDPGSGPTVAGPLLGGEIRSQFAATTQGSVTTTGIESDWLNLTDPSRSDSMDGGVFPLPGDRLVWIIPNNPIAKTGEVFTLTGSDGSDLIPVLDPFADSQAVDANHITGHLLEMTAVAFTETLQQEGIDCMPYWRGGPSAASARSAALRVPLAQSGTTAGKAAVGDSSVIDAGTISVQSLDCKEQPYQIDGDGDGDLVWDYLTVDLNSDGLYDPANDTYVDTNSDGHFDYVIMNQVDGDGDGDMQYEYLSYDANHNGRFDSADGDTFDDYDNDGVFDYTFTPGDLYAVQEQYSNVIAREFRAKGSQPGSVFQPIMAGNQYVQFRTFENAATNRYQAYVDFKIGNQNVTPADLAMGELLDPTGAALPVAPAFYTSEYLSATWDATGGAFGPSTPGGNSGYTFNLGGTALAPGDYTFSTTLASGQILESVVTYTTAPALPVVASSGMATLWNGDGSLTLSWTEPVGTFGQYRIVLRDPSSGGDIFYGRADPGTNQVTLPASLLQDILANAQLAPSSNLVWVMQTRSYDGTNNFARGISNPVTILPPPATTSVIVR